MNRTISINENIEKEKIIFIFFIFLISICFSFYKKLPDIKIDYELSGKIININDNLEDIIDYDVIDNIYIPNNNDPQLLYKINNELVSLINIELLKPIKEDTWIQVYYSKNQELTESNSEIILMNKDEYNIYIRIPKNNYNTLRIDIDGEFELNNVYISDKYIVKQDKENTYKNYNFYIYLIFIYIIFIILIFFFKKYNKINIEKKQLIWKMYKGLIITICFYFLFEILIVFINQTYNNNRFILVFSNIIKLLVSVFTLTIIMVTLLKKIIIQKLYLISAIGFGLFYMLTITPFSPPDEPHHYNSTLKLSNIIFFNFENTVRSIDIDKRNTVGHHNVPEAYLRLKDSLFSPVGEHVKQPNPYNISYPIQYIPQVIGVTVGRILHLNFIWKFYLGRLCNLIFFVICVYFAIKIIPLKKYLVFVIGLLPMCLHQAASFSYDGFINGLSILLVSCILYSIYNKEPVTKKEIYWIVITIALLAPAKVIYYPLIFLIFLIPKERFKNINSCIINKSVILTVGIIAILLFNLTGFISITQERTILNWEGHENYSFKYVVSNPVHTIQIFLNSINVHGNHYIYSTFGQNLSGLRLPLPIWIFNLLITVIILLSIKNKEDTFKIKKTYKLLLFSICLIIYLLAGFSMLIGYTSNIHQYIIGVQGRYFIPFLLPLFLLIYNNTLIFIKNIDKYLICIVFFLQMLIINGILDFTVAKI